MFAKSSAGTFPGTWLRRCESARFKRTWSEQCLGWSRPSVPGGAIGSTIPNFAIFMAGIKQQNMEDYGRVWKIWLVCYCFTDIKSVKRMGSPNYLRWKFGADKRRPWIIPAKDNSADPNGRKKLLFRWALSHSIIGQTTWWYKSTLGILKAICSNPIHPSLLSYCINSGRESELPAYFCFPNLRFCIRTRARESSGPKSWKGRRCTTSAAGQQWIWKRRQKTGSCGANVEDWMKLVMLLTPNPLK